MDRKNNLARISKLPDTAAPGGSATTPGELAESQNRANPPPATFIQLPIWSEPLRGVPNSILRSALFGIVMRGRRRFVQKELIDSWPGITIRYTGMKLDQPDLDVWLLAVHLARQQQLGSQIRFSAYSFLKGIGRSTGKQNRDWLKNVFTRLTANAVEIKIGTISYTGALVHEFFHDSHTKEYVLIVNPRLALLFDDGYSLLDWQTRNALRSDLAKWIHCFVLSHPPGTLHRIGIDRLIELCGSETRNIREFRQRVREAMGELEAIGELKSWCLTKNTTLEFERVEGV